MSADSARPRIDTVGRVPVLRVAIEPRPPITPGRAFLRSLVVPGRGQVVLGKKNAARFYVAVEALGIGMAIKSLNDLREAKRGAGDSTAVEFVTDPVTGVKTPTVWIPSRFTPDLINARRTHLEDWIALIVFNHLLSAADAYVAANLWDFPASVSVRARPGAGIVVGAADGAPGLASRGLEARISGSLAW